MKTQQDHFNVGEHDIFYRSWQPDSPKAILLICHGIAEHSGRYQRFAEFFVARGFAIYAFDHIGHGKSSGKRMHIGSFEAMVETVETMRTIVEEQQGDIPLVLLGHSMGGLVAANYITRFEQRISACALSAPGLATDIRPPDPVVAAIGLVAKVLPTLGLIALDSDGISRDENERQAYLDDPLIVSKRIDLASIVQLDNALKATFANAAKVSLPVLIQHGEADPLTNPQGSKDFIAQISSENKTLKLYPELYHEIFNEPEREQVMTDLAQWLDKTLNI